MEICDKNCSECPGRDYGIKVTGCMIMNSIIEANRAKRDAYKEMEFYWHRKE